MPAPDELNTQVPGENPSTASEASTIEAELTALLEADAADIISGVGALDDAELPVLLRLEAEGQRRDDLIAAIEAEILAREAPETKPSAPVDPLQQIAQELANARADGVVRVDTQPGPVLTAAGWLVPEPLPKD